MAHTAVRADLLQALDRLRALTAQISFDLIVLVNVVAELGDLVFCEVTDLGVRGEAERCADLLRGRLADSEDVRQPDLEPLLVRQVDAGDAGHASAPSSDAV